MQQTISTIDPHATAVPVIALIDGSGLGAALVIAFCVLTGYMLDREVRK